LVSSPNLKTEIMNRLVETSSQLNLAENMEQEEVESSVTVSTNIEATSGNADPENESFPHQEPQSFRRDIRLNRHLYRVRQAEPFI